MSEEINITEPDEFDNSTEPEDIEEINIATLTEPDETEEIKKEIKDAIDEVIKDSSSKKITETGQDFSDAYQARHEDFHTSYSNVLKYWQRDDSPTELSTYYDISYKSDDFREVIVSQQTKEFNTAIKTNYNAKMRNEFGLFMPGTEETFEEKQSNLMFKALNPGLWKFMYDASAYMVFSEK